MLRLKELDILRGFAALNVVLYHYTSRYGEIYQDSLSDKFKWVYGHYGVELFFVISGFVIFMTLNKVKNIREFALKRFIRLFPTYWICLSITLLLTLLIEPAKIDKLTSFEVIMNFTMIQGVFNVHDVDGAYWSLLPELFFYVFIAFIYQIGYFTKIRVVAIIWLLLMLSDQLHILPFGAFILDLKYGMFFLAGILFYELKFNKGYWVDHLLIFACLITAILGHNTPGSPYVFSGIFGLFYLFIYGRLKFLNFPPLLFLGYISYPLYLLHQNIGYYLINLLRLYIPNEYAVILSIFIVIGMAWLVTKYLEKPILQYRNSKLFGRFSFDKPIIPGPVKQS